MLVRGYVSVSAPGAESRPETQRNWGPWASTWIPAKPGPAQGRGRDALHGAPGKLHTRNLANAKQVCERERGAAGRSGLGPSAGDARGQAAGAPRVSGLRLAARPLAAWSVLPGKAVGVPALTRAPRGCRSGWDALAFLLRVLVL